MHTLSLHDALPISGIIAARISADNGNNTVLIDDKKILGGTTIFQDNENFKINNEISSLWLNNQIKELKNKDNLTIKLRTSLAAYHSYNFLLARENLSDHKSLDKRSNKLRQRLWKIRAKKVILATGAIERPLIFNNNDRPGVMLANSVKKYIDFFEIGRAHV